VEMDLFESLVRLGLTAGHGDTLGLEPLSRQAERAARPDRYPIAGINGDYFFYPSRTQPGISTNALVMDGELVRTPFNRSCLVISAAGSPSIAVFHTSGRVLFPDGSELKLDGVNQPRGSGQLVLYTPRFGPTTRTAV